MPHTLLPHHHSTSDAVTHVEADCIAARKGELEIYFAIDGDIDRLLVPPQKQGCRQDELWRTTCFEAFIGAGDAYWEFNFSPSTNWAAYRFDGYRHGRREEANAFVLRSKLKKSPERLEMEIVAAFAPKRTIEPEAYRLGLSAVIQDINANMSYWALAHPPGDPDFHHHVCFALEQPKAPDS